MTLPATTTTTTTQNDFFVRFAYLLRQSSNRTNVAKSRHIYRKKRTTEHDKRKTNTIENK